jgi:hypothetical protein
MEKKIALFAVVLILVFVSNSVVLALTPMGPPKAFLGQDRWDLGIEYGNTTMDVEAIGIVQDIQPGLTVSRKGRHNIENLKSNIIMGKAGYGLNDDWDAFVRLGVADAQSDIDRIYPDGAPTDEYDGFDGSFGLAWGFGTRATFWQDEELSWGGLFQVTWLEPGDSSIGLEGDPVFSGDAEIDIWEVQIAVGPTLRVDDDFRIYGGPFLHFVNGDLDLSGQTVDMGTDIQVIATGDIEEESQFGGYAGAHLDVDENTSCYIECQFTGDAWGVGIGAARRF